MVNTNIDSVKLAVVGCGRWGINHVKTAHGLLGDNLKVVCDQRTDLVERVHDIAPGVSCTASFDKMLGMQDLNAVIIATPAETHFELAKRCLERGLNVLVEKQIGRAHV